MAKKIFVVDDDEDLRDILKAALEKFGYEVSVAADGYQALKAIDSNPPDLMIVDLTMPTMTGWKLSMKIRQDDRFKKTPIIVLSGLVAGDDNPDQKFDIVNAYMVKPFDVFKLLDKVKSLLDQASAP